MLAVLTGCTHAPAPKPVVRSVLSGGARTCTDASAACARSGAVRWVLPLTGTYRASGMDELTEAGIAPVVQDENGDSLSLVSAGDTVFLQTGGQVLAVDAATGRVRWRHVTPRTTGYALAMVGGRVAYQEKAPDLRYGPYLSLDPKTGAARAIPVHGGEDRVSDVASSLLLIHGVGAFSGAAGAGLRQVDPVTGRTRWQVRLDKGWEYAVQDGVLYADDYRLRSDLPKTLENRNQTRLIQRVDLRTGKRRSDVRVPKRDWGDYSLAYVTKRGVIVVSKTPAEGNKKQAFTTSGRPVARIPANDTDSGATSQRDQVKMTGRFGGVRHLSGHGWTGPAMRAPAYETNQLVGSRPRVAVAVACAPDGVRAGTLEDPFPATYCTKARFFGITW